MKFLVDENLPRSLTVKLLAKGCDTIDVREIGKVGIPDEKVLELAQDESRILITANYKHFANILLFPPEKFYGIIAIRMPHFSIDAVIERTLNAISSLKEQDIVHSLIIIESHRIRKRK